MATHFISDLHLSEDTPALAALFQRTLADWAGRIDALYILGDLFEYWVGDDDDSPFLADMLAAMRDFSTLTPLYVMHGNRDFLMGSGFEARSGASLLADPQPVTLYGKPYLLAHGDALCTDDAAYQQFRAMSRNPAWQAAMLARPLAERHAIARAARRESEGQKREQGYTEIGDVTEHAVLALLVAHGWPTLIHGHTHRPAQHQHGDGQHQAQRWVIQDWHDDRGGYLVVDEAGVRAHGLQA